MPESADAPPVFAQRLMDGSRTGRDTLAVEWDYTRLAESYVRRPDYSLAAIDAVLALAGPDATRHVVDLGAGAAHLTAPLAERCGDILAVEPNHAMRSRGMERTSRYGNVRWMIGRMEDTGLGKGSFSMATCGSSFGVADHAATLREVARILEPGGWFACLWNHRDLLDPLQHEIEAYIKARIPGYRYGSRREDQTPIIDASGLFENVHTVEERIRHCPAKAEWMAAWRSHATLQRQAGAAFDGIVKGIGAIVDNMPGETVEIPYVTRAWVARSRPAAAGGRLG